MSNYTKLKVVSMLAVAQASMMGSAHAAADASTLARMETVVVTAQKREQRLLDVPMSVSAVGAAELEQKGIKSIADLSFSVPGMVLREDAPGTQQIFMRGLGNLAGDGALVSVYLDDAPVTLAGARQLDLRTMDIERVEVLKGPQGTLYGQGAVAGTVRFITKKPVLNEFSGSLEATGSWIDGGAFGEKETAIVNLPVVDDLLALRVAYTREHGGGWIDQPEAGIKDGNNQNLSSGRFEALLKPSDKLSIEGMMIIHRNDSDLGLNYEEKDRTISVGVDRARKLAPRHYEYELYNLTVNYDFGFADLISASSYLTNRQTYPASYISDVQTVYLRDYGTEYEGTDVRHEDSDQYSEELRLVSKGDGPWNWTIGAFYRNADLDFDADYDTLVVATNTVYQNAHYVADSNYQSYSLFFDTSYKFFDRLTVGLGVRSFQEHQDLYDGYSYQGETFESTDPRVYVSYEMNPNWNIYANASKGFRSGGFNRQGLPPYDPETLINIEVGTKASLLDNTLDVELTAYRSYYKDMLRRGLVIVGTAFVDLTSNIGEVEITGEEASVTWRATDHLTLNMTGSYIDSEVTKVNAVKSANEVGDPADYVPQYAYTLGAMYTFNWHSGMPGFVRADYSYRDEVHVTDRFLYLPQYATQSSDSIGLLDARIGATWKDWHFEVFGTNLTNENKAVDPFGQFHQAMRTKPRTLGLTVGYDF